MTDGTMPQAPGLSVSQPQSGGDRRAAQANTFPLCPFDEHAVLRDQRTDLFIIYVFSRYKRLMVPY